MKYAKNSRLLGNENAIRPSVQVEAHNLWWYTSNVFILFEVLQSSLVKKLIFLISPLLVLIVMLQYLIHFLLVKKNVIEFMSPKLGRRLELFLHFL